MGLSSGFKGGKVWYGNPKMEDSMGNATGKMKNGRMHSDTGQVIN